MTQTQNASNLPSSDRPVRRRRRRITSGHSDVTKSSLNQQRPPHTAATKDSAQSQPSSSTNLPCVPVSQNKPTHEANKQSRSTATHRSDHHQNLNEHRQNRQQVQSNKRKRRRATQKAQRVHQDATPDIEPNYMQSKRSSHKPKEAGAFSASRKDRHAPRPSGRRKNDRQSKRLSSPKYVPMVKAVKPPHAHDQVCAHPFYQLGLNTAVTSAVIDLKFDEPTPIQRRAIPEVLAGHDLIAHAQTGTGKTAAFILPALQMIVAQNGVAQPTSKEQNELAPHASTASISQPYRPDVAGKTCTIASPQLLVLTPTRELATQIAEVGDAVSGFTGHHVVTIIGGARFDQQVRQLQAGCDALIATPGRLLDLISRTLVDLSQVRILVLDEADRMLDMGFWPSVKKIEQYVGARHQTLFFSATTTARVTAHAKAMLKNPVMISVAPQNTTAVTIDEQMMCVVDVQKPDLLFALLKQDRPSRVLIFCKTKQRVDMVATRLKDLKLHVGIIHADRNQKQRERALMQFANGKLNVLVATDVMSRGIDINNIDWVINYDVPLDPEDYVHRIGRTGRAGQQGRAITLVAPEEISQLREVEYFTNHLIDHVDLPGFSYDSQRIIPSSSRRATKGGTGSRRMGARRHGRSL